MKRTVMLGVGTALPERMVPNAELETMIDTSDEWIVQRTGIRQRYIAGETETTASLGADAAKAALENAGVDAQSIDLIVVATATPDNTFPATSVEIQNRLGISHGYAFDVAAVCTGFIYALATVDAHLKAGLAKRALVIGAETFSRILDWEDRTTCVLFGDGAGAMVVELQDVDADTPDEGAGILAVSLRSDGSHKEKLYVDGGPSSTQTVGKLRMEGREVFRHAVGMITDVIENVCGQTGIAPSQIDWLVPHQANRRIIEGSAKKLGISMDNVVMTVDKHGNTSAASVPLALNEAVQDGRVKPGDTLLLEAMGGGFTWGAILMRV
ncbi:beta-ketoacyl-ACP synthase III [Notoacmeibacter ruber]|uniref:Beta-ketoacyl-[acyl-carrier-protein] synthase III n=1 Tax=Notoacmeibacter ruber TaxID=2670375 RepID=A0A3L7J9Z9_9HYPH|nr:beta-ketoacyl-ACP synthase III [Notoacmeibacter ruber]RLQ87320.1 ketoacyl-ACP synthase III [Notoacmeibacter ruber]